MCGDLDPEDRRESDCFLRLQARSASLVRPPAGGEGLNAYLDELFSSVLERCLRDADQATTETAYRHMAMQSLVLARLAGFLAGHVALNEDPMRKLLEAAMLGYQEAEAVPVDDHDHHGHDHGHDHGHHHGHDHDHGHHHGH